MCKENMSYTYEKDGEIFINFEQLGKALKECKYITTAEIPIDFLSTDIAEATIKAKNSINHIQSGLVNEMRKLSAEIKEVMVKYTSSRITHEDIKKWFDEALKKINVMIALYKTEILKAEELSDNPIVSNSRFQEQIEEFKDAVTTL